MAKARARGAAVPMSDQPWYVRTVVYVGVPTVAMAYLLWWVLGSLDGRQVQHQQTTVELKASIDALSAEIRKSHQEDSSQAGAALDQAWAQLSVMQRICLNTAKTDADRIACATLTSRTSGGGQR